MTAVTETAYAKINLALHVRRREADKYHAIESLFVFAEDGDRLAFGDRPGLTIIGPFGDGLSDGEDNLVRQAAQGYAFAMGKADDASFILDKRLPVASGIGGGSADAAAALRLLCRRDDIAPSAPAIVALAERLGADVPACLISRPVRGEGRGERIDLVEGLGSRTPLLLVNPRQPLATGAVFARWDGVDRGALGRGDPLEAASDGRNDLEPPAIFLLPIIDTILAQLRAQPGTGLVRMSGSGATCFALFEDEPARDAAARAIATRFPDWWFLPTRLR